MEQDLTFQAQRTDQTAVEQEICRATRCLYRGVVRLDLNTETALVLHGDVPEEVGRQFNWQHFLERYAEKYVLPQDRARILELFSAAQIRRRFRAGEPLFSGDFATIPGKAHEPHITVLAFQPGMQEPLNAVYVVVRDAGGDYLLRAIVNQYVYSACDYFIYLDARHNSYTMVSHQNNTPLPPMQCDDYEQESVKYARAYMAKEDQDMVIREMKLSRVLEQLDQNGVHAFTCGVMEQERGYTRKRLEYRYHNREDQMILLSQTDITDVYMEQQEKQRQLESALLRAQTDPLTRLLNRQATVDRITEKIYGSDRHYALLFIDLDNFKKINDTMGHPAGDRVLRQVAEALSAQADEGDVAGRIGGDEFLFFTELEGNPGELEMAAERIRRALNRIPLSEAAGSRVSGSIGVALYPEDGLDYTVLVKAADRKLYRAKEQGKDCYCL